MVTTFVELRRISQRKGDIPKKSLNTVQLGSVDEVVIFFLPTDLKVVVIPGSVSAVVNPSAIKYRFEPSAPVGRVTVVVISITHALSVALFITWVPQ